MSQKTLQMNIPSIERESQATIKRYQEERLHGLLAYLQSSSPYYADLFRKHQIDPEKITTLEDLTHLPVTTKKQLQERNSEFICVPKHKIVDYITTSGTLGDPVTFAMTDQDLDRLAYNEAISFACADGGEDDIYQLMTTIDRRFMAGLAYFLGVRRLGASIVRVGPGMPELQWDTINRIAPTTFITVPSFLLKLIDYAEANGIDYRHSSIQKAVCIGENVRNPDFSLNTLGQKITDKWPIQLYSTYASTEMGTAFTECGEGMGGHHHPELIIVEFLDDNNHPVPEDQPGEVTVTTLGIEGMPLLRFKTGDVCYRHSEPCACGRNTLRMGPVIGRRQQMIKLKGTTLYPPAIYDVLNDIEEVANYVIEVSTNDVGLDDLLIRIGCDEHRSGIEKKIRDHFRANLRVSPVLEFHSPAEVDAIRFPPRSRKPHTFIDRRDNL